MVKLYYNGIHGINVIGAHLSCDGVEWLQFNGLSEELCDDQILGKEWFYAAGEYSI